MVPKSSAALVFMLKLLNSGELIRAILAPLPWFSELTFSLCIQVHYTVTIRLKSMILGIYLLRDHAISVPDPHLALIYITWYSDFALYLWLCLIDKHHILDTCSVSHCE